MTVPTLNSDRPRNADATMHRETRDNFKAVEHLMGLAPIQTVTGANAAATPLDATAYGRFDLSTDAADGANDFDLSVPAQIGQTVFIRLVAKDTQNATITESATGPCVIVTATGGAVASITLDANDEFALLRAVKANTWAIIATSGTVA